MLFRVDHNIQLDLCASAQILKQVFVSEQKISKKAIDSKNDSDYNTAIIIFAQKSGRQRRLKQDVLVCRFIDLAHFRCFDHRSYESCSYTHGYQELGAVGHAAADTTRACLQKTHCFFVNSL